MSIFARNNRGLLFLALLGVFGLGGAAWFLATQPVYASNEQSVLCTSCGLQRTFAVRRVLAFSGQRATNEFVSEICQILRGSPSPPCEHFWRSLSDAHSTLVLRPLPQGVTQIRVLIDLNGLADQKPFIEAMRQIAGADQNQARNIWSNLLWQVSQSDPAVANLKAIVQQNQPVEAVRAFLARLPAGQ